MNNSLEELIEKENVLTIDEALKMLWEWRKYRNGVFWSSVYKWGAVSLALTMAPYLLPDIIRKLGNAVFVFPVMASFVSAFGAYLMAVQYKLYKQVDIKYRSLLGRYNPADIPNDKPINQIFRISIGLIVAVVFLCFAVIAEFFNGLVLFYLVRNALS